MQLTDAFAQSEGIGFYCLVTFSTQHTFVTLGDYCGSQNHRYNIDFAKVDERNGTSQISNIGKYFEANKKSTRLVTLRKKGNRYTSA